MSRFLTLAITRLLGINDLDRVIDIGARTQIAVARVRSVYYAASVALTVPTVIEFGALLATIVP